MAWLFRSSIPTLRFAMDPTVLVGGWQLYHHVATRALGGEKRCWRQRFALLAWRVSTQYWAGLFHKNVLKFDWRACFLNQKENAVALSFSFCLWRELMHVGAMRRRCCWTPVLWTSCCTSTYQTKWLPIAWSTGGCTNPGMHVHIYYNSVLYVAHTDTEKNA